MEQVSWTINDVKWDDLNKISFNIGQTKFCITPKTLSDNDLVRLHQRKFFLKMLSACPVKMKKNEKNITLKIEINLWSPCKKWPLKRRMCELSRLLQLEQNHTDQTAVKTHKLICG